MRIAVIADIHGNLPALEAVLQDAASFSPDLMVDLGDCVSGPLWPCETFERLETLALPTVRGNHDRWVAETDPAVMGASDRVAYDALSEAQRGRLGNLPFSLEFVPGVIGFHATPHHDERYTLDMISDGRLMRAPAEKIAAKLAGIKARIVLCGHSHRQELISLQGGPTILNPGSVGCPAYTDPTGRPHVSEAGSAHARYALIDVVDGRLEQATFRAIRYDHEAAARRALEFGRADWAHAIRTGFMP